VSAVLLPRWSDRRVALAVFFTAILAYLSNVSIHPINADTVPNAYLPASLLGDGDLAFGPFEAPFMFVWTSAARGGGQAQIFVNDWRAIPPGSRKSYAQHYREGRLNYGGPRYYVVPTRLVRAQTGEPQYVGVFGPLAGLTALPLAALAHASGVRLWDDPAAVWGLAKLTAALLIAASAACVFLAAAALVPRASALVLALAYALGSCVWAISSQALWQQTPEILFLALAMACLLRIRAPVLRGAAGGAALAAATACRPTAALVAVVIALWLLVSERRAFFAFVAAALPFAAAVLAYNAYYFGWMLEFGQLAGGERLALAKTGSPDLWQTPLWLGAAGLLASPSRGLLVYSPFLVVAFAGAVQAWRDARWRALRWLTLAVLLLWLPAFAWFDWWGGWAYGYRPIVDSTPLLALLCLPVLEPVLERRAWRMAFAALVAWSVFVQVLGAFAYSPWGWNAKVVDADGSRASVDRPQYRDRLWSFSDWQIGYLVAHFRRARAERGDAIAY